MKGAYFMPQPTYIFEKCFPHATANAPGHRLLLTPETYLGQEHYLALKSSEKLTMMTLQREIDGLICT